MRLSAFILDNLEPILQEWEDFARSIQPPHRSMDVAELRDHAKEMLEEIAAELDAGQAQPATGERASEIHAVTRLQSGFNIDQLVSEYRALRASVLRLWAQREKTASWFEVEDMSRFNDVLDRALAESVACYSATVRRSEDIFLGVVGHDLRTPLQYLSMGAEFLMRSEKSDPQLIQLGSRMFDSAARMGQILDNLLDFTRSRTGGGIQINPRPADLAGISEQVADEFRFSHPDRTIATEVIGDVAGRWDVPRIGQVYQNLIGNALQHGAKDSGVTVRTSGGADGVEIAVHNHGKAIPESAFAGLFDPLHRYANASTEEADRTHLGLGLYIVREIVHAHGGSVAVRSTAGDGTTFLVRLPNKPAA
ncbi:ATP-binding protein [Noviherbaspirillum sp. ST9]|uniref:ATP-binding protein n=1 Tax=Noviherbaspirillum sp. ST9 TaxID=3401606 RepID=UPI003B5893E5